MVKILSSWTQKSLGSILVETVDKGTPFTDPGSVVPSTRGEFSWPLTISLSQVRTPFQHRPWISSDPVRAQMSSLHPNNLVNKAEIVQISKISSSRDLASRKKKNNYSTQTQQLDWPLSSIVRSLCVITRHVFRKWHHKEESPPDFARNQTFRSFVQWIKIIVLMSVTPWITECLHKQQTQSTTPETSPWTHNVKPTPTFQVMRTP